MSRIPTPTTCIRCLSPVPALTRQTSPSSHPRILLLGPQNSGKSTFLHTLAPASGSSTFIPPPTTVSEVTELPGTRLNITDTAGSDRRQIRLHFLSRSPVFILFFLSAAAADLVFALEELEYAVTYAVPRLSQVFYFGIVPNKCDLLPPEPEARAKVGVRAALGTERVVIKLGKGRETRRERVENINAEVRRVMDMCAGELCWEIVDDGGRGVSMVEERGVRAVVEALGKASGVEIVKAGSTGRRKKSIRARKGLVVTAGGMSPR